MLTDSKSFIPNQPERPPARGIKSQVRWAEVSYDGLRFLVGSFGRSSGAAGDTQDEDSVTEIEQVTHVG